MKIERIFFPTIQTEIEFLIGTSKEDNDRVLDQGNPGDIWFHARNPFSPIMVDGVQGTNTNIAKNYARFGWLN